MKKDIERIGQRNRRVEADKAWEVSRTRRGIILVLTYSIVVLFLYAIDAPKPWLNALVPTAGFLLSTLTLPYFKQWWLRDIYKR